jgi:hypothetical protein
MYWLPLSFTSLVSRSCRNAMKGARPVPGPTITIGMVGSAGSLKLDSLKSIRTVTGFWMGQKKGYILFQVLLQS